jgi:hypothetical protein|tara:strand:+ start:195 stop:908 length:714 start_codon:yes stop_codon:yes gene_type:complete
MITKRIYLVFPPGCGGNHLANMIALDDDVEDRFETIEAIEEWYLADPTTKHPINSPTFNGFQNLNDIDIGIVKNATKTQILCCHASELAKEVAYNNFPEELLDDSVFILFSYPIKGSYVDHKHKSGPWIHGEHPGECTFKLDHTDRFSNSLDTAIKDAYQKDNFIKEWLSPKRKAIDPEVVFEFDTEGFHGEFGFEYATAYIDHLFGIVLSKDAERMHQISYANWYKKWPGILETND